MTVLFSPLSVAELELSNRLVVAPMCQYSARDGCATDWHFVHYGALSNSGAGLLVVEATAVEARGRITLGDLGLYSDDCEAALGRVLANCRAYGHARLGIQLAHAGRKASAHVPWDGGRALGAGEGAWETIAPSAIPFDEGWPVPRQMDREDMDAVVSAFADAARRALRLDFDFLELHFAHGYLLHQFLSPLANDRTDAYGGTREKRMRFPLEAAAAVRAAWPAGRPLGARLTGSDWIEGGIDVEDAVALAAALKEIGFDVVCLSSGGVAPRASIPLAPGYQVPFAAQVKRRTGLLTRSVGLISSPEQAERIVSCGEADLVALARAFLDNPHWGWQAAHQLGGEVSRPRQYARAAPDLWPGAAPRSRSAA